MHVFLSINLCVHERQSHTKCNISFIRQTKERYETKKGDRKNGNTKLYFLYYGYDDEKVVMIIKGKYTLRNKFLKGEIGIRMSVEKNKIIRRKEEEVRRGYTYNFSIRTPYIHK